MIYLPWQQTLVTNKALHTKRHNTNTHAHTKTKTVPEGHAAVKEIGRQLVGKVWYLGEYVLPPTARGAFGSVWVCVTFAPISTT